MPRATIIEPQNEGEAPLSYQLSPGQTIETLAVAADFDGSGAAGDFLPTLSMYAQDGRRLGTFSAQTTVVAGNSEQVTFFPFAPPASSGGTGTVTEITSTDFSIQVTNPFGPIVNLSGFQPVTEEEIVAFGAVSVPALGGFNVAFSHVSGATLLEYSTPAAPTFLGFGAYTFTLDIVASTPFSGNFSLRYAWAVADGSSKAAMFKFGAEQIDACGMAIGTLAAPTQVVVLQVQNTDPANAMTIAGQGPLVKFLRF